MRSLDQYWNQHLLSMFRHIVKHASLSVVAKHGSPKRLVGTLLTCEPHRPGKKSLFLPFVYLVFQSKAAPRTDHDDHKKVKVPPISNDLDHPASIDAS